MDFGLVGPSYTASSRYQDSQELINWYLEKDPTKQPGERGMYALYPMPGYGAPLIQPMVGEVRGMRTVLSGTLLIAVIGNTLWSFDPSFTATNRGLLRTSIGPVSITDNGQAAYFGDDVSRYAYTYGTAMLLPIADGGFTGASSSDVVDGFMVYSQPNSQNWGATSLNSTASPALSVGKKDGAPDNLQMLFVNNREVFLLGVNTSEVWVDVGGFPFPFQRIPGTSTQHGCAAKNSIARLGNSFAYVSQDTRGQGIIVVMNGYAPQEISNHSITRTLIGKDLSDAVAFSFQMGGHEFYVVTFPATDTTWVYDAATQEWNKWLSVDDFDVFHRHPANCAAVFQGQVLIGDYKSGAISALDNMIYADNGRPARRLRRCPHIVNNYDQVFFESLQIYFEPGVGLSLGQGVNPQCMLRWSNDGSSTWSNEHWRSIGLMGKYRNRAVWRKLGNARDRVFEFVVTDPVKAVVVSAELVAETGDN